MSKVLNKSITFVYANNDCGGISMIELDWDQDCAWEDGELNDGFNSIEEQFNYPSTKWYETKLDCLNEVNHFTKN